MLEAVIGTILRFFGFSRGGDAEASSMKPIRIRAVAFKDEDVWCAQCLEFDVAAQAPTIAELRDELTRVLTSHMRVSNELNQQPFVGLPRAPQRFFQMYDSLASSPEETGRSTKPVAATNNASPIEPLLRFAHVLT